MTLVMPDWAATALTAAMWALVVLLAARMWWDAYVHQALLDRVDALEVATGLTGAPDQQPAAAGVAPSTSGRRGLTTADRDQPEPRPDDQNDQNDQATTQPIALPATPGATDTEEIPHDLPRVAAGARVPDTRTTTATPVPTVARTFDLGHGDAHTFRFRT